MTTSAAERDLRGAAVRVTKQRVAVLDAVRRHPHADADTIIADVRGELGRVSTQAVYDVLHALDEMGLVRRVAPAGSPARYDPRVGDNHHHLVCRRCGLMVDVDCATGAAPCLEPVAAQGFSVTEAEVIFWGYCPDCQSQGPAPAG